MLFSQTICSLFHFYCRSCFCRAGTCTFLFLSDVSFFQTLSPDHLIFTVPFWDIFALYTQPCTQHAKSKGIVGERRQKGPGKPHCFVSPSASLQVFFAHPGTKLCVAVPTTARRNPGFSWNGAAEVSGCICDSTASANIRV